VPSRSALSILALVIAVSLIGAPLTMHDWNERASISTYPVENESDIEAGTPILQYESLPPDARRAVREAIEHGDTTVYGAEDWPDRFTYSDFFAPGSGLYVVVYEGQKYKLLTSTGGRPGLSHYTAIGLGLQLPFVGYGLFLVYVRRQVDPDGPPQRTPAAFVGVGAALHLLGPEFDFPLLGSTGFFALGIVSFFVIFGWSIRDAL
jgi:hypothetical protein